jgi:hypothetical protein
VAAILIPQLVYWFFSALIVERNMEWFHGPFPLKAYFWIRGASYILQFINTALGGGGLMIYQQRKGNITWRKLLGMVLFRTGLGLWGIGFLMIPATLAMHHYGLAEKAEINLYVWWFILIGPGVLFFISTWFFWFRGIDSLGVGKIIVRDREDEFWTAYREARPRHWLLVWAMVLPPFVFTFVGYYFLNLAFEVNVPFVEFMVLGPLAMLIMDLPIAFAGFGTATLAWTAFFGRYGTTADIAALTLFLPFARAVIRAVIGLVSLRPALRDVAGLFGQGEADEEPAAAMLEPEEP